MSVCAAVPDDDSVPYMPWLENQRQESQQTPKPAPNKAAPRNNRNNRNNNKSNNNRTSQRSRTARTGKTQSSSRKPAAAQRTRQTSLQRGIDLMKQERYEQAKPYLLKAIQEERNNPNAWYWYGVYHEKTGGFYQAQYFYSKAITIDPAFEPLSRVVFYPNDSEKNPLWDPKRPARVYPIETNSRGITSVPPNVSTFPNAPNDPEIPNVPVYTPPEPGAVPIDGDSWSPSVYVPPSHEDLQVMEGQTPVYTPPSPQNIIADTPEDTAGNREILRMPITQVERQAERQTEAYDRDRIIRADKPLYNPPEPNQRVTPPPSQNQPEQPKQSVQQPKKQNDTQSSRRASVPANRVVRQSQRKTTSKPQQPAQTQQSQTRQARPTRQNRRQQAQRPPVSQDVRPQTQRQPSQRQQQRQQQQQTPPPTPQQPEIQNQPERVQPQRRQSEYLPPVGQYAPDPGTISDMPMPPVGQGNQN